jgi:nitrilase
MVGQLFHDQIEAAIRHHAAESACFVVNATGWLTDEQRAAIAPDEANRKAISGGCHTAIISPEGQHVVPPLTSGEGLLIADCDLALVTKRKRMMDSVGHYARPDLLSLHIDDRPARAVVRATACPATLHDRETDDGLDAQHDDRAHDRRLAVVRDTAR